MKFSNTKIVVMGLVATSVLLFVVVVWQAVFISSSDEIELPDNLTENKSPQIRSDASSATPQKANTPENAVKGEKLEKAFYPKELRIPAIDLKADVVEVGITKKGNMAAPRSFSDVGWFKYGTLPGNTGSAVIAGHVDNGLSLPAVFKNLDKLKTGDDIYVETLEGKEIHYRVTGSEIYQYNASAEKIFNPKDGVYLRLITCTGSWLPAYRTHDERIVVSAVKVS